MENKNSINFQPLKSVKTWDTKRIKAYKDVVDERICYLESIKEHSENFDDVALQRCKNYREEIKNILAARENIE